MMSLTVETPKSVEIQIKDESSFILVLYFAKGLDHQSEKVWRNFRKFSSMS